MHPKVVTNEQMGHVFEELIRKFSELSNETAGGTGGMLSVAQDHLREQNPDARLVMYGQELNAESYAICKAEMLIKGQDISNIIHGNTLSDDGLPGMFFDYSFSNPPFGVEWKKIQKEIKKEHEQDGFNGRFGPGLPRVSEVRCCS